MREQNQYAEMLASLLKRYHDLERELVSVADAIRALMVLSPESAIKAPIVPAAVLESVASDVEPADRAGSFDNVRPYRPTQTTGPVGRFSAISMRWACLWMLAESQDGLSTSEIARRMREGGKASNAYNFLSTVSAVLSNMKSRGEVDQTGSDWALTLLGHTAWSVIRPKLNA
jgi:hypothetical protein